MKKAFGPEQDKALTLASAGPVLVEVALSAPYRGFLRGDTLEVTEDEAAAIVAGGVGARL